MNIHKFHSSMSAARLARRIFLIAWAAVFALPALAGDIESAKQQLEKVKVDVSNASWDSVAADIKSTEEFLEGVPDADAAPVKKELAALKEKAETGLKEFKSRMIVADSKRALDTAAERMADRPADAAEQIEKANKWLGSDDATKYVPAEDLAKLKARAASLGQMAGSKAANGKVEFANQIVKQLDETMAADPLKKATNEQETDAAVRDITRLISRVRGAIDGVPAADPRVKAINEKLAAYETRVKSAEASAMAGGAASQLANMWKAQQEYFAGWESEKQGPTWDDFIHKQTQYSGELQMPKTVEVLTRMNGWFTDSTVKSTADQFKDDASVKGTLAEAHKTVDAAAAKLHGAFNALLDGAEKVPTPTDDTQRNKAEYLADRAAMWFKGTPYLDADVSRAKKLGDKWHAAVEGKAAALQEAATKLTAAADAAWPGMASAMKGEDGFTPDKLDQFKGKTIHLKKRNRLGWDYMPAGYDFACEINGMAVAGKYSPAVKAAVDAAVQQTGQSLPDETAWELFATVEGPGKIPQRTSATGKVTVDGQQVGTVTSEGEKSVDCAVIRIVALHAGPVAVGPSGSNVTATAADSSVGSSAGGAAPVAAGSVARSSSGKLLEHLAELAVCVAAAGLLLKQAGVVAAGLPAGSSVAAPGNDNIAFAGLGIAVLGLLWLLAKGILGDLLPALSLTLAGLCISAEWLAARGILPVGLRSSLKGLAMPVAIATVVFGLLHVFVAHWYLF